MLPTRLPKRPWSDYARREADYYVRLNDDDDYLSAELSRINWLQTLTRGRRLAARVTNASILVALIGTYADHAIAGIAWAFASSSLVAWLASLLVGKLLSAAARPALSIKKRSVEQKRQKTSRFCLFFLLPALRSERRFGTLCGWVLLVLPGRCFACRF